MSHYDTTSLLQAQKMREKIDKLTAESGVLARIQEQVERALWQHGLESSESGSDLSANEIRAEVGLYKKLLARQLQVRDFAKLGLRYTHRGMRGAGPGMEKRLNAMRTGFREDLFTFTGATGKAGDIWETQKRIAELLDTSTSVPGATGMDISQLRSVIEAARFGVFDNAFAGPFGKGGSIPAGMWGIAGETGKPEIVEGPARVFSPAQSAQMMGGVANLVTVPLVIELPGYTLRRTVQIELDQHERERYQENRAGVGR